MNQFSFQDPTWSHAVTLSERWASLRTMESQSSQFNVNLETANRRLQQWRSQNPFTTDVPFTQRLGVAGLTEEEFRRLLGEPIEAVHDRSPETPPWLNQLARAYFHVEELAPLTKLPVNTQVGGMLNLVEPLIEQSYNDLLEGVRVLLETHSDLPFDQRTIAPILLTSLPGLFGMLLSRTIALEVNVARLEGLLEGNTPEERFNHFMARLRQPETALAIFREYPVMARQFVIHLNNWLRFHLEFLQHFAADWAAIRKTFSPDQDPGELIQLDGSVGDSHRGGRSVLIAKFRSGFQVVYKPKSLAVDRHFQQLLNWLNERGDHAPFRTVSVLDRGTYGWTEFIEARGCATGEELKRFYERQGGYLALLYALEATDFHFENLIAAGEDPVLIDLESLFHPHAEGIDTTQTGGLVGKSMVYSVLRVGLLPQRILFNVQDGGIEMSGLGGAPGQMTPTGVPFWEKNGTDEMHLTRKRVSMPGGQNRPSLNGANVNPLDYNKEIAKGFRSIYQLLIQHREQLLAEDGPLARFAADEVRFIVRPTRIYALLLHESFHPDLLRNGLDRDRFFDRLWVGIEQRPILAKVITSEQQDLQEGDIPMFTTRPDSRSIWSSRGEEIVGFLDEPGLAQVHRRVQRLGPDDLKKQLWFIDASLTTLSMDADGAQWGSYELVEPPVMADRDQLISAAVEVGKRLEELVMRGDDGDVSWIGVTLINEKHWNLLPLGLDLYSGLGGVAFFLAHLGAITKEDSYTRLARTTLSTIRRQVELQKSVSRSVGGFDGWGAWIYLLTHLSALWNEPELLVEAESYVEVLPESIPADRFLDVLGGTAGCLGGLLALYQCAPSERTLAAAVQCGDHLIASARQMETGIGWLTPMTKERPLAGFSHGVAGISLMLLALESVTGEERFRTAALQGLAYERSLFSPEMRNWPDLRDKDGAGVSNEDNFMLAWCHGAPGIGISRLCSLRYFDDDTIREEIDAALKTTLAYGFGRNHSLCHGDLGNLELVLLASQKLDQPQWSEELNRLASIILESIKSQGWLCGIPLGVETPGLMTGLAGIGYQLLRLAHPERIPSVLVLEPPQRN
jgi:type 2 lantibiotic biosynthesis protein LanM